MRREVKQLEKTIDRLTAEQKLLEDRLADPGLYDDNRRDELADLVRQQGYCSAELSQAEEAWLEKSALLEGSD